MFYVYAHKRADDGSVFYIGKGTKRRAYNKSRNSHWKNIVAKHGYTIEFLATGLDEEFAFLVEQEAIDLYRRRGFVLANKTDGGEGSTGYKHTQDHKEALKGNKFGQKSWGLTFLGKSHTEESRKRMSDSRVGNTNKLGKKMPEESKKKLSELKKDKPLSDEHKTNISKGLMGNKNTRKLTDDEVRFIRANRHTMSHTELGEMFGLHKNTIHKIWRNIRYKDVK